MEIKQSTRINYFKGVYNRIIEDFKVKKNRDTLLKGEVNRDFLVDQIKLLTLILPQ